MNEEMIRAMQLMMNDLKTSIKEEMEDVLDKKLEEKLEPINQRLDSIDNRLNMLEFESKRTNKFMNDGFFTLETLINRTESGMEALKERYKIN